MLKFESKFVCSCSFVFQEFNEQYSLKIHSCLMSEGRKNDQCYLCVWSYDEAYLLKYGGTFTLPNMETDIYTVLGTDEIDTEPIMNLL